MSYMLAPQQARPAEATNDSTPLLISDEHRHNEERPSEFVQSPILDESIALDSQGSPDLRDQHILTDTSRRSSYGSIRRHKIEH